MVGNIKILISGSAFSDNYGAMAMVIGAVKALERAIPDVIFFKGSITKDLDIKRYAQSLPKSKLTIFGFNKTALPFPLALIVLLFQSLPYFRKADIILEIPGDISTDMNLFSQFARFLFSRPFNKNFIIYSCSLGPFQWRLSEIIARYFYNRVSLLIVREKPTFNYLKKLGVEKMILTADLAFSLEAKTNQRLKNLVADFQPFIGLSPNFLYALKIPHYQRLIIELIRFINQKMNLNVLIIPHVEKDKILGGEIYRLVNNPRTRVLGGDYSPEELKGLIGQSKFYLSSRLHAAVAALYFGIPVILLIPRSFHRGVGLMDLFGMDSLTVEPAAKAEKIISLLSKTYQQRRRWQEKIKKRLPEVKTLSAKNALLIKEFLKIK